MAYTGDPLNDDDRSPFLSFLDYIDEPGQVVKNLLRGNFGAAGRHVLNFAGDTIDAALPGNWIPKATNPEDNVSSSELVGLDEKEHPIGSFFTNLVGDTLTNPLSFLSAGAAGAGASAGKTAIKAGLPFLKGALEIPGSAKAIEGIGALAKKGFQALPEGVQKAAEKGGRLVRSTFGAERVDPAVQKIIASGDKGKLETDAILASLKGGPVAQLSEDEAKIVTDIIHNRHWNGDQMLGYLANPSTNAAQRIAMHPGVTAQNQGKITDAVKQALDIGTEEAKRPGIFNQGSLPDEYLPRSWTGQTEEQKINEALGRMPDTLGGPNALKARSLLTPEDDLSFLEKNPGVSYERDARKLLADRAGTQGRMATKAEIAKSIVGPGATLADDATTAKVGEFIKSLVEKGDTESAQVLQRHWGGNAPRGAITDLLAKANTPFKRAAVAGFVIPKLGTDMRNRLSGIWQAASNPESRKAIPGMVKRFISDMGASVSDALGLKMGKDKFSGILSDWEDALTASGGSAEAAVAKMRTIHPEAADLIQSGVLDGYTRAEDLLNHLAKTPFKRKLTSIAEFPQRIMRGLEDRMRLGMGLDLMQSGHAAEDAARITGDSLYRYGSGSVANRNARDLIPFFQFSAKAIPQQAKLLAEKPALATAMASAFGQNPDEPVYPYMQGKLNIPLGDNEAGGRDFLTGMGLPFEALGQIPGSFRDAKRNVIGSSSPLLKTAWAQLSGEDPYFETPVGSYDKIPVFGHQGDLGKAYNQLASTGLIQPLDSLLRPFDQAMDPRRSAGIKALDLLTGAKVASVDPDVALQQQLTEALKTNPDVHQYRGFFADKGDDATQTLIRAYQRAKEKTKKKRKGDGFDMKAWNRDETRLRKSWERKHPGQKWDPNDD